MYVCYDFLQHPLATLCFCFIFLFAVNPFELHEQNSWIVPRLYNSVIVTKAIDGDEGEENPIFYFS